MFSKAQLASLAMPILVAIPAVAAAQVPPGDVQEPSIVITHKMKPSPDVMVRTVYIGDLDLKSAAGQKEMEARVGRAVDGICSIPTPLPSYKGPMEKPCRDEAWGGARPQMDSAVKRATGS